MILSACGWQRVAALEAGERLGYLPGDIGEKLAPYLRPLNDALTRGSVAGGSSS